MEYIVKQGECIGSIAYMHGFHPNTVWNHPKNAVLKDLRKDANVLYQDDVVFIPDRTLKWESGQMEKRHRFLRKAVPARLRIRILDYEQHPMAYIAYILDVDGFLLQGELDGQGILDVPISPSARNAKLVVNPAEEAIIYRISLGELDPYDTDEGLQGRLMGLGFCLDDATGDIKEQNEMAIKQFQHFYELPVDGELTHETKQKILNVYGK